METSIQFEINQLLLSSGIEISFEFVPYSISRNKKNDWKSLNYIVTLKKGKQHMEFDYFMGPGHCPAEKLNLKSYEKNLLIDAEIETGSKHIMLYNKPYKKIKDKIIPKNIDIIYSLIMDYDVLDYPDFEEWAYNFGYDSDSRKDKKIYKTCLKQSLKFKNIVGDTFINQAKELLTDY